MRIVLPSKFKKMIMEKKIKILRETFGLKGQTLEWCLVEEICGEEVRVKPALRVNKSRLYLDIDAGRFYSEVELKNLQRILRPATIEKRDDLYVLCDNDGELPSVIRRKFFIEDACCTRYYHPQMEKKVLL